MGGFGQMVADEFQLRLRGMRPRRPFIGSRYWLARRPWRMFWISHEAAQIRGAQRSRMRCGAADGEKMGGREIAGGDLELITGMNPIEEGAVVGLVKVKVAAEGAVDERVDEIAEGNEGVKVETVEEKRQNILGANALEAFARAVPIGKGLFVALELLVEPVGRREFPPKVANVSKCLRPAEVTVAADHVRDGEYPLGVQAAFYLLEEALKVNNMMKALVGDDGVIGPLGSPVVEIGEDESEMIGEMGLMSRGLAAGKHFGVKVKTFDDEVVVAKVAELGGKLEFQIGISGTDAQDLSARVEGALDGETLQEHFIRRAESVGE